MIKNDKIKKGGDSMLYKVKEVAKILKMNVNTLYIKIRNGEINVIRIDGKSIRIEEKELNRLSGGN